MRNSADDSISHRKSLPVGDGRHGELGDDSSGGGDPFRELAILRGVKRIESTAKNGDGRPLGRERGLVRRGVDPASQTADDGEPA